MSMAAFCFLLLLLPVSCVGVKAKSRGHFYAKVDQEDVTFNSYLLSDVGARTKSVCAYICYKTKGCVTFTFTEGSPLGACRLHSEMMISHCPRSAAPGSLAYRVKQEPGVDECAAGTSGCEQTCTNTADSFTCGCNTGYALDPCNGRTCHDVDECSADTAGCDQTCTNTVGSFTCGCNTGFVLNSDGKTCRDVDECTQDTSGCHSDQTCTNTVGSFACGCNTGYVLSADGRNCDRLCGPDVDGWTVFQRRQDGTVDFYRGWTDYVNGFGSTTGECWLGLETLHTMTSSGNWALRIDLGDWEGNTACAAYTGFYITNSTDNYRLMYDLGSYSGDAGDSLDYHRDKPFTTHDADHDTDSGNCAVYRHGAWWFGSCFHAHLNGEYMTSSTTASWMGVMWYHWKGSTYSLKFSEMKLKRV